jgi:hypothetical protein
MIEDKLAQVGLILPKAAKPTFAYVPVPHGLEDAPDRELILRERCALTTENSTPLEAGWGANPFGRHRHRRNDFTLLKPLETGKVLVRQAPIWRKPARLCECAADGLLNSGRRPNLKFGNRPVGFPRAV